jgi:3-hydroxybutyryl-CoA dehydrogenase
LGDIDLRIEKRRAAVIGGGVMGADIAVVFLSGGWSVHIVEPFEKTRNALPEKIRSGLGKLKAKGEGNLFIAGQLENIPWGEIEIAVEAVPEKLKIKRDVFAKMESLSRPGIPLTSNSSGFPISDIGKELKTRNRLLGLHFFMPAHLAPLVEVVCSQATDPGLAENVRALMKQLGKRPVLVKKDIPGFLANRIQHALMREALSLVEKGIAAPEDVDDAVRYGFGFRYIAAGPLRQKDLTGVDTQYSAAVTIYPDLCNDSFPSLYIAEKVAAGHLGVKAKKGFYDWTDEEILEFKGKYEKALLKALEIMKE